MMFLLIRYIFHNLVDLRPAVAESAITFLPLKFPRRNPTNIRVTQCLGMVVRWRPRKIAFEDLRGKR